MGADNFQRQTKPQDDETFCIATTIAHVDLAVAAPSPWTHSHVDRLRAMCAPRNLKFDHIAFPQAASLSCYPCVMEKDIRAVTALDKTISPDIREPCNAAKHVVSFQKSFVQLCKREKLHKWFSDKPYKAQHANGTTSRLAAVVPWVRYLCFKRRNMPFRSVYSPDNNARLTRFPDSQAVRGFP